MVEFTLPYPARGKDKAAFCRRYGLNSIYAGKHWSARLEDKNYFRLLVRSELQKQGIAQEYMEGPVEIVMSWDDGLDCDNHAYMGKLILDSLSGYLLHDDSRQWVQGVRHEFNREGIIRVTVRERED